MALNPEMRASDADRDRVTAALREHCAQGRISIEELSERLDSVYGARTLGELEKVTSDLPEHDMYELPVPASHISTPVPRAQARIVRSIRRRGWTAYITTNLACIGIWLLIAVSIGIWYPWFLLFTAASSLLMMGVQFVRRDHDR
jgi:hypothetical protein